MLLGDRENLPFKMCPCTDIPAYTRKTKGRKLAVSIARGLSETKKAIGMVFKQQKTDKKNTKF